MQLYELGETLRRRRRTLKMSQEEVACGLCASNTVHRIEAGLQTPRPDLLRKLLQRLKLPETWFFTLAPSDQAEISRLERALVCYNTDFESALPEDRAAIRQKALATLRELETLLEQKRKTSPEETDAVTRQEILRSRVLLGKEDGFYSHQEELRMLTDALHMTLPRFSLENMQNQLYTETEIKLLNQLAISYIRAEKHQQAIAILRPLSAYLLNDIDSSSANWLHAPLVLSNYARELAVTGQYGEAIQAANRTWDICLDNARNLLIPFALAILAECYYHTGDTEKSVEFYKRAYWGFKNIRRESDAAQLQEDVWQLLGQEVP